MFRRQTVATLLAAAAGCAPAPAPLDLRVSPDRLPADGASTAAIAVFDARGATVRNARIEIAEGRRYGFIEGASLRAAVLPGRVRIRASAPGFRPAETMVETTPDPAGPRAWMHLDDGDDRRAFLDWFTFLAEAQAFRRGGPHPEISDCAALIRFAYREALRAHTGEWAAALGLPVVPAMPAVRKYEVPYTPAGAALFPVRDGGLAEFADAETLRNHNAAFISRDVRAAQAGDIFFYRQSQQNMPHHAMVFLGRGHFAGTGGDLVVYHTGPIDGRPGEIRRVALDDLAAHPDPRWRPVAANPGFLGIYRWNIVRELP